MKRLSAGLLVGLLTTAHAGTWSTSAWTGDASTGIVESETVWAYHFGSSTAATIDGVSVPGVASPPGTVAGKLEVWGFTSVLSPDLNNLTALGGNGSAVLGNTFFYGGDPASLTVKAGSPLVQGKDYVLSIFSVGWDEAPTARTVTFHSGSDQLSVNQNMFGENFGVRVDYAFTAGAGDQTVTIDRDVVTGTFHLYAVALRAVPDAPLVVTSTADSGAGSLRAAVTSVTGATPTKITFAPSLSGQTINLTSGEIAVSGNVTLDASSLPQGLTIRGNGTNRVFYVNSGAQLTGRVLTLTGGGGAGQGASGYGGAIENVGTLRLHDCTLWNNSASTGGGAIDNGGSSGSVSLINCALHDNSAQYGGAIDNYAGTTSLLNSTFTRNRATLNGAVVFNEFNGTLEVVHCTVVENFGPVTSSTGALDASSGVIAVSSSIVAGNGGGDVRANSGNFNSGGGNVIGTGSGASAFTNTGDVRDVTAAQVALAELGRYGGRTDTMPPLPGSPALDAAVTSSTATDQRGFARSVDGNFDSSTVSDSGAAESFVVRCTTSADQLDTPSGSAVSLREAARDAPAGAVITTVSTNLFSLTRGEVVGDKPLILSASSQSVRWAITPGFGKRMFYIAPGARVHFSRLDIGSFGASLGGGRGAVESGKGGCLLNQGDLSITDCLFTGLAADYGGLMANGMAATPSHLLLRRCSLRSSTAAADGGAIYNASANGGSAAVELENCLLTANTAGRNGGALFNFTGHGNATLAAVHCTVMNNKATRSGGGLYNGENFGIGTSTLTSCVIAMNTAPTGPDVTWQDGSINSGGTNLIGVADADGPAWSVTDLTGTPAAPLSPQLDSVNFNPLAGSPVLDAAAASTILLDRSRQPRTAEGDFTGAALPDIGATEATTISVTTTADELDTPAGGSVSLREAIRDSGSNGIIRLDAALNGQTLTLDQARGEIALSKSFSLDASQVPGGFTIDGGPGANRLFTVSGSATVLLRGLTLQGGAATGDGGAILVSGGRLTLEDCVLTGNTATGSGGALASTSFFNSLTITRCSFTNNAAAFQGGAIHVAAATSIPGVQLSQCTIEGNRSGLRGGGLSCTSSSLSVDQCTFTRNEAAKQHGGGIVVDLGSYNTSLSNSIVADNRAPASPDLVVEATGIFTRSGTNLIGVQPSTGVAVPAGLPNANGDYVGSSTTPLAPLISPLGYYGGRTPTCLPLPGSPALDRATGVTSVTDQRGFARSVDGNADGTALPDIGAAESVMVRVDVANDELDTPAGTNDVSLREAVRDAPAGAVIGFAPALSGHTIRVSSALSPSRALVISGSGLAQPVTLSALPGPSGSNVLGVGAGNSVGLSHLRFFGCSTPGDGGAILNFGRLGMTDCELSYNSNTSTAGIGGAIYSGTSGQSSWLKMTRCVLSGNYSIIGNGGALVNRSTAAGLTAEALLEDCVLSGNSAMAPSAGVGGAISNLSSNGTAQLTARRCTFSDNQSAARAGAVNNSTSSNSTAIAITTLDGCTLSSNACPFGSGGAVANYASQGKTSLDLLQCTLVNNQSSSEGGAVLNNGVGGTVNVRIKQCTITGNVSGGTGGAVTDMQFAGVTTLTLDSSIVAGNLPANRPDVLEVNTGTIVSLGNNLIGNTDNSRFTWPSGDLTGTTAAPLDPLLAPLDFYGGPTQTMPPMPGSPAREPASGATTATGLADQRGLPRLVGAKVDIGAVEADAPDAPGVIAFGSAVVRVNEGDAPAMIPVYRTAGTIGTVTVKATTTTGSGTGFATSPDDFGAVTNYLLTFGPGETVKYVPITIVADPTLKEPNETFTLTLSDVTGNATLGTQSITIVRIIDAYDASAPTLTLTAPAANAIVLQASGPGVTVSGTAKDDKGVQSVQVQLNGGPFVDAVLSGPSTAPGFTLLITATPGVNSLVVRTVDEKGKISALVKRSFTYKVTQTLTVIVSGPANSGTMSAGFMPTSQRDVGVKYTVTAMPKPGFAFIGWGYSQSTTVHPVPSAGIGELDIIKPTLTFIMQPGLTLIANFDKTPFTPSAVGTHTGLILPSTTEPAPNGTTPGNATTGLFTVTLTSKGTLITGSLKIDGTSLPFIGTVPPYGDAIYFGTGATSTTTLKFVRSGKPDLDLTISNEFDYANAFSGKLTQKVGGVTQAVSTFMAYRSAYSATAKVPSTLVSGSSQRFNLMLQPVSPQPGLTAAQFPQGNGIGYLTLGSSGSCSFAGSLADGTPFTASGALNANNECPVFASLYSSKGHLAGIVNVVLPTTPSYDAYAVNMLWNRPVQLPTKVQWYPSGWPTSINLDLVGAKFTVPAASANQSVIPGLGALDGTNTVGNAVFYARDGLLTSERSFGVNISTKNVVTPLPLTTPNFTLKLTAATGELSGTFLHTDGTKPAFKATTLQKPGDYQGSYGWFLSTSPKVPNGQGQGGEVKLLAR